MKKPRLSETNRLVAHLDVCSERGRLVTAIRAFREKSQPMTHWTAEKSKLWAEVQAALDALDAAVAETKRQEKKR